MQSQKDIKEMISRISKLMGHAKELIIIDVYGDNANIIPEEISKLLSNMDDVMPNKEENWGMKPESAGYCYSS